MWLVVLVPEVMDSDVVDVVGVNVISGGLGVGKEQWAGVVEI